MALDRSWPMEAQFERDLGPKPNPFGLLPAFFVAKSPGGDMLEYEADLEYHALPGADCGEFNPVTLEDAFAGRPVHQHAPAGQVLWSVQFFCPRCNSPLYVPTKRHPAPKTEPREIIVHWDKCVVATADGVSRPTFTIIGAPLKCDYLWSEVRGITSPSSEALRCGWIGIIEAGRCYEHSKPLGNLYGK